MVWSWLIRKIEKENNKGDDDYNIWWNINSPLIITLDSTIIESGKVNGVRC